MQILLTRQEIRQQLRAHLGQTTNDATAAQTQAQYNAFIDAAALKAHGDCAWLSAQRRATVDLGVSQYKLAYPTDTAVGSILEVALYDAGTERYTPLRGRNLPTWLDFDQLETLGGADFAAIQGEPCYWQQRGDYIYLYPPNDTTARKVRLSYVVRRTFVNDSQQSTVDGQAILYWAASLAYGAMADSEQRTFYQSQYADRISQLRGFQNTGQRLHVDARATFDEYEDQLRPMPNWDTRPRT